MTRYESHDEQRLRELLDNTVSGIEPDDRLNQILDRTKVTNMSARRPWLWGAGGAALATAAVITAVAMIGNPLQQSAGPGPSTTSSGTPTQATQPTPTEPTESSSAPVPSGAAVPVYYVGNTPQGPRLYREFQPNVDGTEPVSTAVSLALGSALDPDYGTGWPAGASVTSAGLTPDLITIGLAGNLHDRPAGMTESEAQLAIEQLIYTAQAAYQHGRVPVQFLLNDSHTDRLLGQPASEPLSEGDLLKTLALVNITDPAEGTHVSGTLHVTGLACTFEANVPWQLLQGTKVVDHKSFMAEQGCDGVKLYPFAGDVDLSGLSPGTYTLRIQEDDPSNGEGPGPTQDTRTIVVE
jgi:hypothetical protein